MSASGSPLDAVLAEPPLTVAPRLLGGVLRRECEEGTVAVRITEVEAYDGADDPGSHAHRGLTVRNAAMFGPPAHLYVYLIYGMHHCCNVVTQPEGTAGAVLLRAGEVVEGIELVRQRRAGVSDRDLARGPGRLGRALDLRRDHDGADLRRGVITLRLPRRPVPPGEIASGPRVGLRLAADRPWRFWIAGDPSVSPYRGPSRSRTRRR